MEREDVLYAETYKLQENADWVVFIHGAGGSGRTFKYQLEAFKRHYF